MALSQARVQEIPKDAVVLSEDEAFAYQWRIIKNWDKQSEVWSLRYSPGILGALSAFTGMYMNNHYRNKLKLGNYGRLSTYLPIVVLPAIMSTVSHRGFIQKDLVLNKDKCPICYGVRASLIQTTLGILYPIILAPIASFMYATRHYTYYLPSITEKPKEVFNLWRKMTKPIKSHIVIAVALHAFLCFYLTEKQIEQLWKVKKHLYEIEESTGS